MSAEPKNSECLAIQKNFLKLKDVVTRGNIPSALYQNGLVTEGVLRMTQTEAMLQGERAERLLFDVDEAVKVSPEKNFESLCSALSEESLSEGVVKDLRDMLKSLKEDPEYEDFQSLKGELETYSRRLSKTSDEDIARSVVRVIQDIIKEYIGKAVKYNVSLSKIESNLNSLCEKVVIPTELWGWVQQEITEFKKMSQANVSRVPSTAITMRPPSPESPLFCKETLYHAALCCVAISNQSNAHTFFQSRRHNHGFSEVSFTQVGGITPYLIAMHDDTIYVAFQGTLSLDQWAISDAGSFNEVLQQQCNDIPLRYFIDELNNNKKIVFTGFSFGGMLACCVCVKLWQTTTKQEVLLARTTCITFAQPFLPIKMVDNEIAICPQFEKSIHCVFNVDDLVPLLIRCSEFLFPRPKVLGLSPDVDLRSPGERLSQSVDLFTNQHVRRFIECLGTLQKYSQQTMSSNVRGVRAKRAQLDARKKESIQNIKKSLAGISTFTERIEGKLYGSSYIISQEKEEGAEWQQKANHLAAIQLSHRTNGIAVDDSLFEQHTMDQYMSLIYRSYLEKSPDSYTPPNHGNAVQELTILKPKIIRLDIHEHPNEHVLVLKGENLWFSYKICFDGKKEIHTTPGTTTKTMVEFKISHFDKAHDALFCEKQVKIALFTHFAKPIRQAIDTRKESHVFSVRESQLAKHTPTEVIRLAFLCVLLEQRSHATESARFKAVAHFLEDVVKVVPLESVFNAIAYEEHEIAVECAIALKERAPQLQLSHQMIVGAGFAATRASSGYRGDVFDEYVLPLMFAHNMLSQLFSGLEVPEVYEDDLLPTRHQSKSHNGPKPIHSAATPPSSKNKPSYSAITKNGSSIRKSSSGEVVSAKHQASPPVINLQPPPFIPVPIPIVLNEFTEQKPFPPNLVEYLNGCVEGLLKRMHEKRYDESAVGNTNIEEVYPVAGTRRNQYFRSPKEVLREAMSEIEKYTEETHRINPSKTEATNKKMLNLIDKIYNHDVAVCAALLGAFMEQQIRIPLINSPKETADEIAQAAPVAVGVWALFSQNLNSLQKMLSSPNRNALIIEIKEYVKGVDQQLDHENRRYAGKLQFLLHGIKETVTASSEYISYSLERQLYNNIKFDKKLSLKHLITHWDELFEGDALSLIGKSHHSLVARWLKWTILVHDLREALSQHTCIGVTGLVNSGKSLLVKKLFKIEKVKVGTRAVKRTTLPLLYNLEEKIDGLDVIDFPGVDDSDSSVPEMAKLLLSLAQIVIFVVDYRKAKTDPVKDWLKSLTSTNVPVLVCLTYADVLYLECEEDQCESMIMSELTLIQKNLKLANIPTTKAAFYSLNNMSGVTESKLKEHGIKSLSDVGDWLVETLKTRFHQEKLADNLRDFLLDV